MSLSELEEKILAHIRQPNYHPVKPRVIAKQLKVDPDQRQDVRKAIKRLAKKRELKYGVNHLVYAERGGNSDEVVGRFSRAAAGYGFVRPETADASSGRSQDIYIPLSRTRDAATGDTVLVRMKPSRKTHEDRVRGEILRVIERRTNQFVGTYFEQRGQAFVDVDGKAFDEPIYVGDPGAKTVKPKDKVVIEMVRFPAKRRQGEAVIVEVLGNHRKPGVDTLTIMREFALPDAFPEAALEEARAQAAKFDESIQTPRRDLTESTVITIDPIDARDFDDAISLTRLENGHWRLGVHIADVAHFVQPKSALDEEARDRATSIYLPTRVIPMLPEIISNNLASLQPDKVRYTKTAFLEFTAEGAHVDTELCSSAIRSQRRFAYVEVDEFLANPTAWKSKLTPNVHQLLTDMHALAMILRRRRFENGSLEMDMPEVKLDFDRDGKVVGAHQTEHTESHQIIEEFMLAANIGVAQKFRDDQLRFLRRIHGSPSRRKIKKLTEFVQMLGLPAENLENRFELKSLLKSITDTPLQHTVTLAVLQSMQKAVYSPEAEGHYALASKCYCHFTSPIRRYPDLTVHRMIDALESGQAPVQDLAHLSNLGEHCSQREQRAEAAERQLTKLKLLSYFETRIGEELEAVVDGVESYGVFVRGLEIPVEGLIHVDQLPHDYFELDEQQFAVVGKRSGQAFRLGDVLRVEVAQVDMMRREIDFRLVERLSSMPRPKTTSTRKGGKTARGKTARGKTTRDKTARGKSSSGKKARKKKKPAPGKKRKQRKKPS